MRSHFEIVDMDSSNHVGAYDSRSEAMQVLADALEEQGEESLMDLALFEVSGGVQELLLSDLELIRDVRKYLVSPAV